VELTLCYVSGPPGAGKSTLMAALTDGCARTPVSVPFAHDTLTVNGNPVGVELGRRREKFPGTDTLAMNVHAAAAAWISRKPHATVLGEGARLATTGFMFAARAAGYRLIVVALDADDGLLRERRDARGARQNETWAKGATTRARRFAHRIALEATVYHLPARAAPQDLAAALAADEPALSVFRG
jgi:predicted nucleotide kinase in modified base biosynthesis